MTFFKAAALALAPVAVLATTPALAEETANALSVNSPIQALMANEAAKAVVVKHLGPLDQHPMYEQFKAMSLPEVMPWSQGMITEETLAKIKAELEAL